MRFASIRGWLVSILSIALNPIALAVEGAIALAREVFELFAPEPLRLAVDGPAMQLEIDGHAVPSDVQQSLRHEAAVPRYAAMRNT